jgi:hypothetical protein
MLEDEYLSKKFFIGVFSTIAIKNLLKLFMTTAIFSIPFKLISLISHYKIGIHIVIYMNIIFKILPGLVLISILFITVILTYSMVMKKN